MSAISRRFVVSICAIAAAVAFAAVVPAFADVMPFTTQAFQDAQNADKPILIEIHASWCPTCKEQKAILNNLLLPEPKFKDMVVLRVDFDSQKNVVSEFGARMQSTLIVYRGKKELGRSVGDTDPDSIAALLEKAL
jgi:thioredoxin 1